MLLWSHSTHHYALLRYAISVSGSPEDNNNELICTSAFQGDKKAVEIFLEAGKCSTRCINKALQAVSGGGRFEVIELLLNARADVNAAAAWGGGRTALQAASEGGHFEVIERLVNVGTKKF